MTEAEDDDRNIETTYKNASFLHWPYVLFDIEDGENKVEYEAYHHEAVHASKPLLFRLINSFVWHFNDLLFYKNYF